MVCRSRHAFTLLVQELPVHSLPSYCAHCIHSPGRSNVETQLPSEPQCVRGTGWCSWRPSAQALLRNWVLPEATRTVDWNLAVGSGDASTCIPERVWSIAVRLWCLVKTPDTVSLGLRCVPTLSLHLQGSVGFGCVCGAFTPRQHRQLRTGYAKRLKLELAV